MQKVAVIYEEQWQKLCDLKNDKVNAIMFEIIENDSELKKLFVKE